MTMRVLAVSLALLIASPVAALDKLPGPFNAQVTYVLDGDTVDVDTGRKEYRIRLAEIDAPESDQRFGGAATRALRRMVEHQIVRIVPKTFDDYNRVIAHIELRDGTVVNRQLVRAGWAWHYKRYSADMSLHRLQQQARQERRGLWQERYPTPPWRWRHR